MHLAGTQEQIGRYVQEQCEEVEYESLYSNMQSQLF